MTTRKVYISRKRELFDRLCIYITHYSRIGPNRIIKPETFKRLTAEELQRVVSAFETIELSLMESHNKQNSQPRPFYVLNIPYENQDEYLKNKQVVVCKEKKKKRRVF